MNGPRFSVDSSWVVLLFFNRKAKTSGMGFSPRLRDETNTLFFTSLNDFKANTIFIGDGVT